jgi:AraC-like DNA-binding protein
MELARRLLREPWIGIAEIAARCGYAETSHFYRRFKDAHASTPAAWRRQALSNGVQLGPAKKPTGSQD